MEEIEKNAEILTVEMDTAFKKQLGFLGIIYQICGIITIISGAMMCIGIITAIVGVPYIMAGIKVFKSGGSFSETTRNADGNSLKNALAELSKAVKIMLITFVILIAMYILIFIIMMIVLVFAAASQGY